VQSTVGDQINFFAEAPLVFTEVCRIAVSRREATVPFHLDSSILLKNEHQTSQSEHNDGSEYRPRVDTERQPGCRNRNAQPPRKYSRNSQSIATRVVIETCNLQRQQSLLTPIRPVRDKQRLKSKYLIHLPCHRYASPESLLCVAPTLGKIVRLFTLLQSLVELLYIPLAPQATKDSHRSSCDDHRATILIEWFLFSEL
jgi:hypothetical protein